MRYCKFPFIRNSTTIPNTTYYFPWTSYIVAHHVGICEISLHMREAVSTRIIIIRIRCFEFHFGFFLKKSKKHSSISWWIPTKSLTSPCTWSSCCYTATGSDLVWSSSGTSLVWHFWRMSLVAIFLQAIPQEGGGTLMSCSLEAWDGGHPTIDQKIYRRRKSGKTSSSNILHTHIHTCIHTLTCMHAYMH